MDDGTKPFDLLRSYQCRDDAGATLTVILGSSPVAVVKDFSACFRFDPTLSRSLDVQLLDRGRLELRSTRWVFDAGQGTKTVLCQWCWASDARQPVAAPYQTMLDRLSACLGRGSRRITTFILFREVPAALPDHQAFQPITAFLHSLPAARLRAWIASGA